MQMTVLKDICEVRIGLPISRAKQRIHEESWKNRMKKAQVIVPKAISEGLIDHQMLAREELVVPTSEFFTLEGDVVAKLSVPYECVYIAKRDEGLLVPSFCVLIRARCDVKKRVDMRFLAAWLNMPSTNRQLAMLSNGSSGIQLLKKSDLESLDVPLLDVLDQRKLSVLADNVMQRRRNLLKLMDADKRLLDSFMQDLRDAGARNNH